MDLAVPNASQPGMISITRSRSRFATAYSSVRSRAWKRTEERTRAGSPTFRQNISLVHISRTTSSISASLKRLVKRCDHSISISMKSSRRKKSPAWATVDLAGLLPVLWIRSHRLKCRQSVTAFATSSAFSIKSFVTAGNARSPINGCVSVIRGNSRGRRQPIP